MDKGGVRKMDFSICRKGPKIKVFSNRNSNSSAN